MTCVVKVASLLLPSQLNSGSKKMPNSPLCSAVLGILKKTRRGSSPNRLADLGAQRGVDGPVLGRGKAAPVGWGSTAGLWSCAQCSAQFSALILPACSLSGCQ